MVLETEGWNTTHQSNVQQQWRKMFDDICNYAGDDPLLPWLRCIKWARDTFPYETKSVDLSKLLATCISIFENDERYRNDLRFLKVWIIYADSSNNFEQVYSTMEEKGIGRWHSLFYEAYATYLELQRKLCQANDVYLLGLSRQAEPLASLKDMHTSFLNRMVYISGVALHKDQKQCGSFNREVLPEVVSSDNSSEKAWNSVPAPNTKFSGNGEFRQGGCARQDSSFHGIQAHYSRGKLDNDKLQQEVGRKSDRSTQILLGNDVPSIALDRKEQILEETRSRTLPKRTQVVSESINVESQQETERKSLISYGKRPDPWGVSLNFEDNALCNRNNAQEIQVGGQHVSSCPVSLTERVDNGDSNDLQDKNGFSAPVQGIEVHDADVHKMELKICSTENLQGHPCNQVNAGLISLVHSNEENMTDEMHGCHPPTLGPCSRDELCRDTSSTVVNENNFESISNSERIDSGGCGKVTGKKILNPWAGDLIASLLKRLKAQILKYNGYNKTAKNYTGKISLSSLQNAARNKLLELGGIKYHVKGCSGQGAFGQVFRAHVDGCSEDVVALKIQKPPCPWEFYMYRQLDNRIPAEERSSFGSAWKVHVYSDCSILICDYVEHGTLQDVINSYLLTGQCMDEVLCVYYTIEMLRMLETLHSVGLIHGDFKPDNLLIRYGSNDTLEDWDPSRTGTWKHLGLCLIDWGRGIDTHLFPSGTQFQGDCRTSGFRCIQMQEKKPWTFQVDSYGLCVIAHMMLHGSYMELVKKTGPDGHCFYYPKAHFKRYWNGDLWKYFFHTLLNIKSCNENPDLGILRKAFEDYLSGSNQLRRKLKQLLMKQKSIMCSGK